MDAASDLPQPPTPYATPAPYQPHGALEWLGKLGRDVNVDVGRGEGGIAKLLALALGGASAYGNEKLKYGEDTRNASADFVKELNTGQKARYDKELGMISQGGKDEVFLPGVGVVRKDSPVYKRYQEFTGERAGVIPEKPVKGAKPPKGKKPPDAMSTTVSGNLRNQALSDIKSARDENELADILSGIPKTRLTQADRDLISQEYGVRLNALRQGNVARR